MRNELLQDRQGFQPATFISQCSFLSVRGLVINFSYILPCGSGGQMLNPSLQYGTNLLIIGPVILASYQRKARCGFEPRKPLNVLVLTFHYNV
ncbi:hypothetical protein PBI_INGRID_41 [Arthrobacter phage Ingrid]|nr:hypothetical protein PBI_INGRID_41 [Arthrobacter phage Ingrid]QFG11023.1 hypothetical protein PBI_LORETTA_41 [Arthrobacter phage Loretta]